MSRIFSASFKFFRVLNSLSFTLQSLSHKPIVARIWLWLLIRLFGPVVEPLEREKSSQTPRTHDTYNTASIFPFRCWMLSANF